MVLAKRMEERGASSEIARKLEAQRGLWKNPLPVGSSARALHFPLMALIAKSIDFPDTELINDMRIGMPSAGVIPETPTLTARCRGAVWSVAEWRASAPRLNAANIDRAVKSQGSEMAKERYEKPWTIRKKVG